MSDQKVLSILRAEAQRQQEQIELIASENFVSKEIRDAQGSVLTNKYAEGYPGKRYYGGCVHVDQVEELARDRLKQLFHASFVNVQPHSGSNANLAVYLALLKPFDKILGMSLLAGGHLTHGHKASISGQWLHAVSYDVHPETHLIDYDAVRSIARKEKPKLIIAGGSAYARIIDFNAFRSIADEVGAYLLVDMAHFAGLVAGGHYPSPLPYADIVTSTTHKTLRGPRGGIILTNNEDIAKKIDAAVMPGLQGGPLMHVIAAKAIAFWEALQPEFKEYTKQVILNAKVFATELQRYEFKVISGGTDSHLVLADLTLFDITGKDAERALEEAHITCNKNAIPNDPQSPFITSGIRLGTPAMTTRGMKEKQFEQIAELIYLTLLTRDNTISMTQIRAKAMQLCAQFPIKDI